MTTPDEPGLWIFSGLRYTTRRGFLVEVNDICEVRDMVLGFKTERVVLFMGRATLHKLEQFRGTWRRAQLDIEGERTS